MFWVLLRSASLRRFKLVPTKICFVWKNKKKSQFWGRKPMTSGFEHLYVLVRGQQSSRKVQDLIVSCKNF